MNDLISRQAVIDALCDEYCGGWKDCKRYPKCESLKAIQNLPSAQPEIIRCKDCKFAHLIEPHDDWWECEHDKRVLHSDGFCSWGERKEE